MRPPPLNYIRPHSVRDALVAAHESSDGAVYLAGGQDLLPSLNRGDRSPSLVVDLKGALDLGVSPAGPQWLGIGALTTHHQLSQAHASRSWSDAVSELGPLPVRTRATVGGHLAAGAPGDFWPTLLTALDGRVELVELGGRRLVAVAEALSAVRRGHGLVCGVLLPRSNDLVGVSRTRGYTPAANAMPRLTCAIRIVPDSACRVADARVVIGGANPPRRLTLVEAALLDRRVDALTGDIPPTPFGALVGRALHGLGRHSRDEEHL